MKRIEEHKGVQGYLIINNDGTIQTMILSMSFSYLGIPIRSNLDASLTQQYAALIKSLSDKARSAIREIDPANDLVFFRIRTKKHEILVAPGLYNKENL